MQLRSRTASGGVPREGALPSQPPESQERARFLLVSELEHSSAAQQALSEFLALLQGRRPSAFAEPEPASAQQLTQLTRLLDDELANGRVQLELEPFAGVFHEHDLLDFELPPLGPGGAPSREPSFISLHLVDQKGAPVPGRTFQIELPDGSFHRGVTDPDGFGRVRGFNQDGTAKITFAKFDELDFKTKSAADRRIIPVGEAREAGDEGVDPDVAGKSLVDAAEVERAAAAARSGEEEEPEVAELCIELFDKTGRVRHANRTFQITGPKAFEGTTDDEGRIELKEVPLGDYSLSLALDFFLGDPDAAMDIMDAPLIVRTSSSEPQVRMIGAVPRSVMARLNMFFNTDKTFLLPTALPSVRKLRRLYASNSPCQLLVVGHADTRGGPAHNDKLSLERAEATIAYLKDDVDGWFKFYSDKDPKKCWGKVEDHLMIISLPDFVDKPKGEDEIRWFQRTRSLKVDGTAGEETRRALIEEYMTLDGASLSDFVGKIEATAHGCGENFPLDDTGKELDTAPADQKRDRVDRRVELFFFDPEFGITPPPPGPNSAAASIQYPLWRKRLSEIVELTPNDPEAKAVKFIEISDAHFRTNSAVVLPEGETPDASGTHAALTTTGLVASALRFVQGNEQVKVLVAGHTDTRAEKDFNQTLSNERAEVALSLLKGGTAARARFQKLCNGRHKIADVKQILSWVSKAIPGFACAPRSIDETPEDKPIRAFQTTYNAKRAQLNPDPKALPIGVDGSAGEETWGAFFDCYEFALKDELGEDDAGLAELRSFLIFVDDRHQFLGFGEHFPIEELGVDEFRSQTNRRAEILFFEPGEEPDLDHAADDPQTSELYLPGNYAQQSLPAPVSKNAHDFAVPVRIDLEHEPTDGTTLELTDGTQLFRIASNDPSIRQDDAAGFRIYTFVDVPLGRYQLDVVLGASKSTTLVGIRVTKQGILIGRSLVVGTGDLTPREELDIELPPEPEFFAEDPS